MKVYIVNHETLDFFPHLEGYWQCTPIAMDFSFSSEDPQKKATFHTDTWVGWVGVGWGSDDLTVRLRSASFDLFNELLRDFLIVTQGKETFKELDIEEIKKKTSRKKECRENKECRKQKSYKKIRGQSVQQGQEEVNSRTASKKRKIKRRKLTKK